MANRLYTLFVTFWCLAYSLYGQSDTLQRERKFLNFDSLLHAERLGYSDVLVPLTRQSDKIKIISGSRFPIESDDLPYSVYVITKEEIRQNGYETLVDALKMAPGIRVSQPGSAIEGETFLMRGFLGNTYTKILINDVPIKPIFVGGMPIGAQLPIKEAERIEIIYGAGSAIYGGDTNAGVINIITNRSQRPVYTQADLSVGQGLYSSVNVMFGARLGRDKRIFNLFAYGSNVLLERRNTFYDEGYNYNPVTYLLDTLNPRFMVSPNYAGTKTKPILTNTPHLSRKFGISLNYKGITFSVESMYRRDHSAIGMNPLAVSYANPLTYTGEGIWRGNLNFFKDRPRMNSKWDITFLHYRLDNRSSALFVQNHLSTLVYDAAGAEARRLHGDSAMYYQNSIFKNAYDTLFSGLRYMYGVSDELRVEHVRNFRLLKRFSLTAGVNGRVGFGSPITYFVSRPVAEGDVELNDVDGVPLYNPEVFPVAPQQKFPGEASAFGQLFYNWKNINIIAGVYASVYSEIYEAGLSPRIAGLWKLNKKLKLRASWGQSFRPPSLYYNSISYFVTSNNLAHPSRSYAVLGNDPEKTVSFEGGVRWQLGDYLLGDLTWFNNQTTNLLRNTLIQSVDINSAYEGYLGYESDFESEAKVRGWQLHLRASKFLPNNWLEAQYNVTVSKSNNTGQIGIFGDVGVEERPSYTGQIHQLRLLVHPGRRTVFILDGLWVRGIEKVKINGLETDKFFTLDAVARFAFNQQFSVYVKVTNVFDKKYPGIRATGTPDDLHYNPQNGTFFRLGMNYSLE